MKIEFELQHSECKSKEAVAVKKAFVNIQEKKVSLMQEDYKLEKEQILLEAEIEKLKESQNILNQKDREQIKYWEEIMKEFETGGLRIMAMAS